MAQLVVVTGPQKGTRYRLPDRPVTGGRSATRENYIVLDNPFMGQRHFMVRPTAGGFAVSDLPNLNGVAVNEERVSQDDHVLADGDVVCVSGSRLVFLTNDDTSAEDALRKFREADNYLPEWEWEEWEWKKGG